MRAMKRKRTAAARNSRRSWVRQRERRCAWERCRSDLVAEFGCVPIPSAWRKSPALYHAYWDAVDDMSESIKARFAKPAMKKCVELGAKFQLRDEHTRACEAWLAKNYKNEFHVVDELLPELRAPDLRTPLHSSPSRDPSTPPDR